MHHREVTGEREFLCRPQHGEEWLAELEAFAAAEDVASAWVVGFGAVEDATVRYYDQDEFAFRSVDFDEPLSMPAFVGNVTRADGDPTAEGGVVLSRRSGQALAGRLDRATVFAGELRVRSFEESLERERDDLTDLDLWL
ncbi:MAG: PPC domain-containing DNA-binding protein [Halobacteriaceae archaeon]